MGRRMVGLTRILPLCAVVLLVLPVTAASDCSPFAVQRVFTRGALGNEKTTYLPGETIQFAADLNNSYGGSLLAVNGTQVGITTSFYTDTKPTDIPPGISTWSWNAVAPSTEGKYTFTVTVYDSFYGVWVTGSAYFTVSATPAVSGQSPLLFFPWDYNENPWVLTQGPHDWNPGSQSGLDFDKDNTPRRVLSMFDGEVTFVGLDTPFTCWLTGQQTQNPTVKVRATDGSGWELWYLHLSSFSVSVGSRVSAGDLLGYSGDRGCSDGLHLHVELLINGQHASWWGKSIIGSESPAGYPRLTWQVSSGRQNLNSATDTRPPISPLRNWTMDANNNCKASFVRGEAIHYATEVRNVRNTAATVIFTIRAGGIFYWQGAVTVPSGGCCAGLARYHIPSTIPTWASSGTYYLEVLITYTGPDIDNQTITSAASALPFTVR